MNFLSLKHDQRGRNPQIMPSDFIAQFNYAKIRIPQASEYGMFLRSPGDVVGTAAALDYTGRLFQFWGDTNGGRERGLIYPALWVDQDIFPKIVVPQIPVNVDADSAQTIALDIVGGGTVARIETKFHPHGGGEYKVIIVNDDYMYEVDVDAYDGTVKNWKVHQITKTGPGVYNTTGVIGANRAKSIAIERAGGGGIITECTLENKPSEGLTYHVHVANGQYEYCVELNALTGVIFKVDPRYKP